MRDLRELSGPWRGFFIQRGRRGAISATLAFNDTHIKGYGSDLDGVFVFEGAYHPRTEVVELVKRYDALDVQYRGRWDGQMIAGTWRFAVFLDAYTIDADTGVFELWPASDEESLAEVVHRMALISSSSGPSEAKER